jgi:hypothetical protein
MAGGVKKTRWIYIAIRAVTRNMALKYSLKLPVVDLPGC